MDPNRLTSYTITTDEVASLLASTFATEDCGCGTLAADPQISPSDEPTTARWKGIIGVEGELTGDGRYIQPGALRWESLPIPLRYVSADQGAHQGAIVVGRIDALTRDEDTGAIYAEGDFDLGSDAGREAARLVQNDLMRGVSMDLDDVAFEVRVAADAPALMTIDPKELVKTGTPDEDGRVKVQEMAPDDEVMVTTGARVRAATLVAVPAFSSAQITMEGEANPQVEDEGETETLSLRVKIGGESFEVEYPAHSEFNWVEDVGGLPKYIERIKKHLVEKGMDESHAIAVAVNVVKKMCESGDVNFPGKQNVNKASQAEACAAVAEWEDKKARANADGALTEVFADPDDPDGLDSSEDRVAGKAKQTAHSVGDVVMIYNKSRPRATRASIRPASVRGLSTKGADSTLTFEEFIELRLADPVLPTQMAVSPAHPALVRDLDALGAGSGTLDHADAAVSSAPLVPAVEVGVRTGLTAGAASDWTFVLDGETLDVHALDRTRFRDYSPEARLKKAASGDAMEDGSFPISNCADLSNAIRAIGRAKHPQKVKAHIRTRAEDLKCKDVHVPWSTQTVSVGGFSITVENAFEVGTLPKGDGVFEQKHRPPGAGGGQFMPANGSAAKKKAPAKKAAPPKKRAPARPARPHPALVRPVAHPQQPKFQSKAARVRALVKQLMNVLDDALRGVSSGRTKVLIENLKANAEAFVEGQLAHPGGGGGGHRGPAKHAPAKGGGGKGGGGQARGGGGGGGGQAKGGGGGGGGAAGGGGGGGRGGGGAAGGGGGGGGKPSGGGGGGGGHTTIAGEAKALGLGIEKMLQQVGNRLPKNDQRKLKAMAGKLKRQFDTDLETLEVLTADGMNPQKQMRIPRGNGRRSGRWVDMPGTLMESLRSEIEIIESSGGGLPDEVAKALDNAFNAMDELNAKGDLSPRDKEFQKDLSKVIGLVTKATDVDIAQIKKEPDSPDADSSARLNMLNDTADALSGTEADLQDFQSIDLTLLDEETDIGIGDADLTDTNPYATPDETDGLDANPFEGPTDLISEEEAAQIAAENDAGVIGSPPGSPVPPGAEAVQGQPPSLVESMTDAELVDALNAVNSQPTPDQTKVDELETELARREIDPTTGVPLPGSEQTIPYADTLEGARENLTDNADEAVVTMLDDMEQSGEGGWVPDPEIPGVWGFQRTSDNAILAVSYNEEADFELSVEGEAELTSRGGGAALEPPGPNAEEPVPFP